MQLGKLFFVEPVGRRTEVVDLDESPSFLAEIGVGETRIESTVTLTDITRRTAVCVYPHRVLAEADIGDRDLDLAAGWIRHEWLERLRQGYDPFHKPPGLVEKVRAFFKGVD